MSVSNLRIYSHRPKGGVSVSPLSCTPAAHIVTWNSTRTLSRSLCSWKMLAGGGLRQSQALPNPTHNTTPQLLPWGVFSPQTFTPFSSSLSALGQPSCLLIHSETVPKGQLCAGHRATPRGAAPFPQGASRMVEVRHRALGPREAWPDSGSALLALD